MFTALFTDAIIISPYLKQTETELVWSVSSGPEVNSLSNGLSELSFRDMKSRGIGLELGWMARLNEDIAFTLESNLLKANLYSGSVRDSDYSASDIGVEVARSIAHADQGSDEKYSAGAGLKYRWFGTKGHYISLLVGLVAVDNDIDIHNGVQYLPTAPGGSEIVGLASSYDSRWTSIFYSVSSEHAFTWGTIGVQVKVNPRVEFDADANWNLRSDLSHPTSFAQTGEGDGVNYVFGYSYSISGHSDVYSQFEFSKYQVSDGYDQTFFKDGSSFVSRLNNVELDERTFVIGYRYWF